MYLFYVMTNWRLFFYGATKTILKDSINKCLKLIEVELNDRGVQLIGYSSNVVLIAMEQPLLGAITSTLPVPSDDSKEPLRISR